MDLIECLPRLSENKQFIEMMGIDFMKNEYVKYTGESIEDYGARQDMNSFTGEEDWETHIDYTLVSTYFAKMVEVRLLRYCPLWKISGDEE